MLGTAAPAARAGSILIPNGSFEDPLTAAGDPRVDQWQKADRPEWYTASGGFTWDQLSGVFVNPPPGSHDRIENLDGNQGLFLFAVPQVALFQDYAARPATNSTPEHVLDAKFTVGKVYTLTVGVAGGGGGLGNGATLELSLCYRQGSNLVTVAATTVTNSPEVLPLRNHLVDFQVRTPTVKASDAWAGENIGVRLLSTVSAEQVGGYWQVDNVRLIESIGVPNGSFESPSVSFSDARVDSWQKSSPPDSYSGIDAFSWDQLTGLQANPPRGSTNRIDNLEGNQALFLSSVPGASVFQDDRSVAVSNLNGEPPLQARFDPGQAYRLTVGVVGGRGGMPAGATLELSLYYRQETNRVTVAATTVTNSPGLFPTATHLVDFQVHVPTVTPSDAWAGQNLGVEMRATGPPELPGGYWELDNIRLEAEIDSDVVLTLSVSGSDLRVAWASLVGLRYQARISNDLKTWRDFLDPLDGTGEELSRAIPKPGNAPLYVTVLASAE